MRFGPPPRMMIFFLSGLAGFVFVAVGGVEIRRVGLELGGAGIDEAVGGDDAVRLCGRRGLSSSCGALRFGDLAVGEAEFLGRREFGG